MGVSADEEPKEVGVQTDFAIPEILLEAYMALAGGAQTAREVAEIIGSDANAASVGELFLQMQDMGLVKPDEGGRWETLAPNLALTRMIDGLDQQIASHRRSKDAIRQSFTSLQQVYEQQKRQDYAADDIEILQSPEQVRDRISELSMLTQREVLAMHPTMASAEVLEQGMGLDRDLLARGVEYKVLWPHTARRQRSVYGYFETLVGLGAQMRTADAIPARILVMDRRHALVAVETGGGSAAVVSQPVFVSFLLGLFEQCWQMARPVAMAGLTTEALEDIEVTILVEMARGRTDDAIARRLNVSTRTVRRYVSQLSERLNLSTRFQLGLVALHMGILDEDEITNLGGA